MRRWIATGVLCLVTSGRQQTPSPIVTVCRVSSKSRKRAGTVDRRNNGAATRKHTTEVSYERFESYEGPTPHPDTLDRYEKLWPGAAELIFHEFEAQSQHRRQLEKRMVTGNERRATTGQWMAFIIAIAFLAAAVYLATTGHETLAAIVAGFDITGLVTVFALGRRSQRRR